ncbi:MAG: DUF1801 domain-containing protein [Anaerolineales bacterium]
MKTVQTDKPVLDFLNSVEHDKRREDSLKILEMMTEVSGEEPAMWGDSIVGFGNYTYEYKSGRTGEWMYVGFSPRKQNLTLYIMDGFDGHAKLLGKLGKYKTGKSCLYINKLEDIDQGVLRELIEKSVAHMKATNG